MKSAAARHFDRAAGMVAALDADPREQWTAIADEMITGRKLDPEATQREIGERMGQTHNWVSDVLTWRTKRFHARETPFARGDWEHRKQQIATKTPVKQADRVKMAEELLADPKVVKAVLSKPTVAARGVANAVHEKEAVAKTKGLLADERLEEIKKATLSGIESQLSTMITRINQWALALDSIRDDVRDVQPSRQTELVDRAVANLERSASEFRLALGYPSKLRVIESSPNAQVKQLA